MPRTSESPLFVSYHLAVSHLRSLFVFATGPCHRTCSDAEARELTCQLAELSTSASLAVDIEKHGLVNSAKQILRVEGSKKLAHSNRCPTPPWPLRASGYAIAVAKDNAVATESRTILPVQLYADNQHMGVFISHSFGNKPEFDNIADALAQANVVYWNPAEVKPGSSLRDQLRRAVEDCNVCIFIATRQALESSWCGAELGAFWGSGKPVIVYLAEPSLAENDLPPIVQGDVWERRISRVVARASELTSAKPGGTTGGGNRSASVGNMTAEQLERLIIGAISLAAATSKDSNGGVYEEIGLAAKGAAASVAEGMREAQQIVDASHADWRKQILWVDDRPDNNVYERRAFESLGVTFTLALSTREALDLLSKKRFGAIISDMGREEGPREGYVLLDAIRSRDNQTPFFIYAGSNSARHKREAEMHGAQGSTNNPSELFDAVRQVLR